MVSVIGHYRYLEAIGRLGNGRNLVSARLGFRINCHEIDHVQTGSVVAQRFRIPLNRHPLGVNGDDTKTIILRCNCASHMGAVAIAIISIGGIYLR